MRFRVTNLDPEFQSVATSRIQETNGKIELNEGDTTKVAFTKTMMVGV